MPFLIDGNNLLWSTQNTGWDSEPVSDVQLCRILGCYLKQIGETGRIVFDGAGPKDKSPFDNISNLEVFFAGLGRDADTVIEAKIRANTAPKRLTVVSSDRRLRKAALARKAVSIKSDVFWNNIRQQLSRRQTAKEPPAKRSGLSESETEQWLRFFDLRQ
jgi:predicted RNA-binding protein with PIN domain